MALITLAAIATGAVIGGFIIGSLRDTSENINNLEQKFLNNITNQNNAYCSIEVANIAQGTKVIVENSNVGGDIIGSAQTLTANSSCLLNSSMENNVTEILNAIAKQNNETQTSTFLEIPVANTNVNNIVQDTVNNIININNQMCSLNSLNFAQDTYVGVKSSSVGGSIIGVTQDSNTSSSCAITNTMKNVVYNQAQAELTQFNKKTSILGNIIVLIILLIIVAVVIFIIVRIMKGKKENKNIEQSEDKNIENKEQVKDVKNENNTQPEVQNA